MDIHPIRREADYEATLEEIPALMDSDSEPGVPDGDRLDILATLAMIRRLNQSRGVPANVLVTETVVRRSPPIRCIGAFGGRGCRCPS
jgi:antitoxin component HigA of HigAB toxin-antitoxin module